MSNGIAEILDNNSNDTLINGIEQLEVSMADSIQTMELSEMNAIEGLEINIPEVQTLSTDLGGRGLPGVGLNYNWDGTKLGVKRESETAYHYSDLKGDPGTTNYNVLINKPMINGTSLNGNVSLDDLGVQPEGEYPEEELSNIEIEDLLK